MAEWSMTQQCRGCDNKELVTEENLYGKVFCRDDGRRLSPVLYAYDCSSCGIRNYPMEIDIPFQVQLRIFWKNQVNNVVSLADYRYLRQRQAKLLRKQSHS